MEKDYTTLKVLDQGFPSHIAVNHGKLWARIEEQALVKRWLEGEDSLHYLAVMFGRIPSAIAAKLIRNNVIPKYSTFPFGAHTTAKAFASNSDLDTEAETVELNQENIMSNVPLFEARQMLNGVDVSTLSDDEIYSAITRAEKKLMELRAISHKPKRLIKLIKTREQELLELIAYLDLQDENKVEGVEDDQ